MHTRWVLVTLLALIAGCANSPSKPAESSAAPSANDEQLMMQKWMEFASPGPQHAMLNAMAGKWDSSWKMWFDPAQPPMESTSSSTTKSILGGRYVMDEVTGNMMGETFHGIGITGYDNMKKKFVSVWVDSGGTGVMLMEGDYDAKTKTYTYTGQGPDVMSGKYIPMRMTVRVDGPDHMYSEMFGPDKSGKEFKTMEMHMTRVKEPK